jgi:hypothetical protein
MNIDDCIEEYEVLGEQIFGHPRPFSVHGLLWDKHDYKKLEHAAKHLVQQRLGVPEGHVGQSLFSSNEELCRTCVSLFFYFATYYIHGY